MGLGAWRWRSPGPARTAKNIAATGQQCHIQDILFQRTSIFGTIPACLRPKSGKMLLSRVEAFRTTEPCRTTGWVRSAFAVSKREEKQEVGAESLRLPMLARPCG